jgi:hypothetical protein
MSIDDELLEKAVDAYRAAIGQFDHDDEVHVRAAITKATTWHKQH